MLEQDTKPITASRPRRPFRRALIVSGMLHACLLGALLFLYYPQPAPPAKPKVSARSSQKPTELVNDKTLTAPTPASAERVRASVQTGIERVANASPEQKLGELDSQLKRLERSADQQDVEDIVKTIADAMGLKPNLYDAKPAPAEGKFDPNTAQLQEVKRSQAADGTWTYQAQLIDSAGRTATVPLNAAEGQSAFEMFEKLKQYPMADQLYRQIVMPMIQQMLEPK